jgi:serine/threonine-protein kinase RsbW
VIKARHAYVDVPAVLESVDTVQEAFASWWDGLGDLAMTTRFSFETAVIEIATNIVEHTRRNDRDHGRRFTLALDATDTELTAVFTDNGMPADIDLSAVTMADIDDESGRGLALALATLDSLDYRHESGRNIWTLVCKL